jgi:hypothetical protein
MRKEDEIKNRIEKSLLLGTSVNDLGIEAYKKEIIIERFTKLKNNDYIIRKQFGYPTLDKIFEGGVANGEIFSFIGPSHSGKSMFLVNMGANLMLNKYNVVHITLEMSENSTIQRYDMRLLGTYKKDLGTPEISYKLKDLYKSNIGRLFVKKFPAKKTKPSDINIYLTRLSSIHNIKIDAIILDYCDILGSDTKYNEKRHVLEDIYFDFKTIWRKEGDNYARTLNRFNEIPESISLVRQAIENMPKGDIRKKVDIKSGYGQWRNEAPRGEVTYMAETNGNLIKQISIRTPSIMNIDSCAKFMLKDVATIADAIATYASADPCIACAERVAIVDSKGNYTTKGFYEIK